MLVKFISLPSDSEDIEEALLPRWASCGSSTGLLSKSVLPDRSHAKVHQ